jgi:hypothetical protein
MIVFPKFLLPFILSALPQVKTIQGKATTYWPGDGFCGVERADGKPFRKTDSHIAHRNLPLGTRGIICNESLCVFTSVQDRGPFGVVKSCKETENGRKIKWEGKCHRWKAMTKLKKGWRYRGKFDLTKPVSDAIGHRAFDIVTFYYFNSEHYV